MSKKSKVEKDTSERWLLTYADLMNLLLIFFIVMYSMSLVDKAKFDQLSESLREAFGTSASNKYIAPGSGKNSMKTMTKTANAAAIAAKASKDTENKQMAEMKGAVEKLVQENNLTGQIGVTIEERGVKISITAHFLFDSGSAEINKSANQVILDIGKTLNQFSTNTIKIEGHTDTDPINNSQFPSNWELSSARATNVLRFLISNAGLNPSNISSVGYGEYHPVVPNTDEQNKSKNRRVDIVILKQDYSKSEGTNKY